MLSPNDPSTGHLLDNECQYLKFLEWKQVYFFPSSLSLAKGLDIIEKKAH